MCAKNNTKDGFKIGVVDWKLGKTGDPGSFEIAKKLGIDGVQVSLAPKESLIPLKEKSVQQKFIAESKKHNVQITSLAIGALNGTPYKSSPIAEKWVAESIDVCKALGVTNVLLAFFGKRAEIQGDHKGIEEVVKRLKKIAPKAEDAGVVLGLESWLSAWETKAIIDRVGSKSVKMYYDVGNSHLQGYDIYEEIRWLGTENICEFHAKDYSYIFGKGKVNFPAVREAMDDIGYRGWIQIEGKTPLGLEESYRQNEKYLRKIFPPKV